MPEPINTDGTTQATQNTDGTQVVNKEELVTRVSQVKPEALVDKKVDEVFNVNDIDKIENPQAKEYAQKAYKSLESGYTKKFQSLADERRAWETKKTEGENWTQEKVQSLLKDPNFVTAAQGVATQQTTDEYSALSDIEKKRMADNEKQIQFMVQQNSQLLRQQQDESNKTKYKNYDSDAVDIITNDLLKNKVQATREHLWKVVDYDAAVNRAYELGKSDRNQENLEKVNVLSPDGVTVVRDESVPDKEKGESDRNYWNRLGLRNLQKLMNKGQVRK